MSAFLSYFLMRRWITGRLLHSDDWSFVRWMTSGKMRLRHSREREENFSQKSYRSGPLERLKPRRKTMRRQRLQKKSPRKTAASILQEPREKTIYAISRSANLPAYIFSLSGTEKPSASK